VLTWSDGNAGNGGVEGGVRFIRFGIGIGLRRPWRVHCADTANLSCVALQDGDQYRIDQRAR